MNVQGVQWVADLVGHARRQQRERLNALCLNRGEGFRPRLSGVMDDEGHAGAARSFAINGRGIDTQETMPRIADLQFVAYHPGATASITLSQGRPIELRQEPLDRLPLDHLI